MEDRSRPSFPGVDAEKEIQIVGGSNNNNNNNGGQHIYAKNWSRPSADLPPHFPAETGPSHDQLGAAAPNHWRFRDPDTKRRKRIAKYKGYNIAGRVKTSIRNGVGWIKNKCSQISHGY